MLPNKHLLLSLALLLALSGCGKQVCDECDECDICHEVDIPVSDESFHRLFDSDLEEFDQATEVEVGDVEQTDQEVAFDIHDFTWVEDTENPDGFRPICFGFDRHVVAPDQEEVLAYNIERLKASLVEDPEYQPTVIIEGHACHSAGSPAYNMLISEKRARAVCDRFIQAGLPEECLKVVARGDCVPAILEGMEVTGDRVAQARNRRCEMRIIHA